MTKRALAIGTDSYGGDGSLDLAGCRNDARSWAAELERRGFTVTLLLDATRDQVLGHLDALIAQTRARDTLVVTASSHGTYVRSTTEPDGTDEAWVTADRRLILDDDLYAAFRRRRPFSRHMVISDSCHSGDLIRGIVTPQRRDLRGAGRDLMVTRFLPPLEVSVPAERVLAEPRTSGLPKVPVPLLAACAPHEVAWETTIGGHRGGLFTHHALAVLREEQPRTLRAWADGTRARLQGQTPQLDASRWQRAWRPL